MGDIGVGNSIDSVISKHMQVQQRTMQALTQVNKSVVEAQSKPLGRVAPQSNGIDVYA